VLRITYSWDSPAKWGRVTLEMPNNTVQITVPVEKPRAPVIGGYSRIDVGTAEPDMCT